MPARIVALITALAIFVGVVLSQRQIIAARSTMAKADEILYLPNQKLLNYFTGGLNTVVADLLWLECIQYVATENRGERKFTWLQQMANTVVQLDPKFGDAYRYGGMFLAALRADDEGSVDLLERGFIENPQNVQLPYELAMIFILNRKDEPGARERATYYLSLAASIDTCPEFIRNFATTFQEKYNLEDIERDMWKRMSGSSDKLLRELANRKLVEIELRKAVKNLNDATLEFRRRTGRFPNNLQEMSDAQLIPPVTPDPLGGTFFMGEDGVVRNTTLLDSQTSQDIEHLKARIDAYRDKEGHFPESLEALSEGDGQPIPPHPYPNKQWQYVPASGLIE